MRTLAMLCAAVIATGCVRTATNPATGKVDVDIESPTKQGEDWSGTINAVNSNINGEVKAMVAQGQTSVTVSLTGGSNGQWNMWLIHEGRCTAPGAGFMSMSQYPNLTFDANGRATVNVTFQGRLDEAKDYVVVIHGQDMNTVVACGNLDD
jgi:hypothetical protein